MDPGGVAYETEAVHVDSELVGRLWRRVRAGACRHRGRDEGEIGPVRRSGKQAQGGLWAVPEVMIPWAMSSLEPRGELGF